MHSDQIPKVMEEPAKSSFNWGLNLLLSIILAGLLGAILPGVYRPQGDGRIDIRV